MANIFIKSLKKIPTWKVIDIIVQGNLPAEFWENKQHKYTRAQIKITHEARYKDESFQIMLSLDKYSAEVLLEYLQEIFKDKK